MPGSLAPSQAGTQGAFGLGSPGATEDAAWRRVIAGRAPPDVAGRATVLGPVVAPEREAVGGKRLLDLLDRLLAEVRDRAELVLALRHEVADGLDPDPLEAVVRADAELELLDREVLHPVSERDLRTRAVAGGRRGLAEALDLLDVG